MVYLGCGILHGVKFSCFSQNHYFLGGQREESRFSNEEPQKKLLRVTHHTYMSSNQRNGPRWSGVPGPAIAYAQQGLIQATTFIFRELNNDSESDVHKRILGIA